MQVRDVMTRDVFTVGPDTSAKYAAEVLTERGFAALPVVDGDYQLAGIVAEVDLLRDRLPPDPRLHLRRNESAPEKPPPLLVRGVMSTSVRTVDAGADVADLARLFVDERIRSVPVLEHDRLVGIVSRRDLLRALVRPDDVIRHELLRLVEGYTGELGYWDVDVEEGVATVRRTRGRSETPAEVEQRALRALAHTVPGVVAVRIVDSPESGDPQTATPSAVADAPA